MTVSNTVCCCKYYQEIMVPRLAVVVEYSSWVLKNEGDWDYLLLVAHSHNKLQTNEPLTRVRLVKNIVDWDRYR